MDEFVFVLLAALVMLIILLMFWGTPEQAPVVEPAALRFVAKNGTIETFILTIYGNTSLSNVTLLAKGDIATWVKFEKSGFDVPLAIREKVKVEFRIPLEAKGSYAGYILVSSKGGSVSVPVEVSVIAMVEQKLTTAIALGTVEASYVKIEKSALDVSVEVWRSYFAEQSAPLVAVLASKELKVLKGAKLRLKVEDTNALAPLQVYFNEKKVYEATLLPGEVATIELGAEHFNLSSRIHLKAMPPGWKFWQSTHYRLGVQLGIELEGSLPHCINFTLSAEEVEGFESGMLSFKVLEAGPSSLSIKLNEHVLHRGLIPFLRFSLPIEQGMLHPGKNQLEFEVEPYGTYKLAEVRLLISYTKLT